MLCTYCLNWPRDMPAVRSISATRWLTSASVGLTPSPRAFCICSRSSIIWRSSCGARRCCRSGVSCMPELRTAKVMRCLSSKSVIASSLTRASTRRACAETTSAQARTRIRESRARKRGAGIEPDDRKREADIICAYYRYNGRRNYGKPR
jgi:hypothetical protein